MDRLRFSAHTFSPFLPPNLIESHVSLPLTHSAAKGGAPCDTKTMMNSRFFETMSKRRKGFPSETHVKRGVRIVRGDKLLEEKLGRNDLCPCGSGARFKNCCLKSGRF